MKNTAVEWFAQELYERFEMKGDGKVFNDLLQQAKEMEKEQIENAYKNGRVDEQFKNTGASFYQNTSEQYYNETYEKDKSES